MLTGEIFLVRWRRKTRFRVIAVAAAKDGDAITASSPGVCPVRTNITLFT